MLHMPQRTPSQQSTLARQRKWFSGVPTMEAPVAAPVEIKLDQILGPVVCIVSDDVFGPIVHPGERAEPTLSEIMKATCRHFGLSQAEIKSVRRQTDLTYPRHMAMYICHTLTGKPYPTIARLFGDRNHTSVIHAVRHIQGMFCARNKRAEADHDAIVAVLS